MRKLLILVFVVMLVGCATSKSGDDRVYGWNRAQLDTQLPIGSSKSTVFASLGKGSEDKVDGITRWTYSGSKKVRFEFLVASTAVDSEKSVVFVFDKNDKLIDKIYKNF